MLGILLSRAAITHSCVTQFCYNGKGGVVQENQERIEHKLQVHKNKQVKNYYFYTIGHCLSQMWWLLKEPLLSAKLTCLRLCYCSCIC